MERREDNHILKIGMLVFISLLLLTKRIMN